MEAKHIARELVASSSYARSFNPNLILIAISIAVSILTLFTFCPKVKAVSYPTMSIEQADFILDYFANQNINEIDWYSQSSPVSKEVFVETLNNCSRSDFASAFNNTIVNTNFDLTWENIMPCVLRGKENNNPVIYFYFLLYPTNVNQSFAYPDWRTYSTNGSRIYRKSGTGYYYGSLQILSDEINTSTFGLKTTTNTFFDYVPQNTPIIENNTITNMPFILNINSIKKMYYSNVQYDLGDYFVTFNNDGTVIDPNASFIEDDISPNGAYFWNGETAVIDVNSNKNTSLSGDWFFIGKNLEFESNYYYSDSNNNIINANNLIYYDVSNLESGNLYMPSTKWYEYFNYYPERIWQDIKVTYLNGDDFEEKYITEHYPVLVWSSGDNIFYDGTWSGTISNPSGEIIGNFSGDIGQITQTDEEQIQNLLNIDTKIHDPTADFFTWFFLQLKECFTVNTAQYLSFTILDNQFIINSDDYIMDIPVLNTILGAGSGIFILYGIFKDIRKEIEKVKQGDFEQIGKEDISANML